MTHILLSASSEIDVIIKQLCAIIAPEQRAYNINDYQVIIKQFLPDFINEEVWIDRFGLSYKPWDNWNRTQNPNWWRSYNNVKHQRNNHFHEANLQNTINAVGALLLTVIYYYKFAFIKESGENIEFRETTRQLQPGASFMRINADYYFQYLTE